MIGVVLLAAGSASRMGEPKQLLEWNKESFLQRAIRELKDSEIGPVVVVTGAWSTLIHPHLEALEVAFCENLNWKKGMGSSMQTGLQFLIATYPELEACLLVLVDQVLIQASHLQKLVQVYRVNGEVPVAAAYQGRLGVPALFPKAYFPNLLDLPPQVGARKLLNQPNLEVQSIPLPEAAFDIDTPEAYAQLLAGSHQKN